MRSLDNAESQVRKYESTLSEEDIVPADTTAIQNLRDQLGVKQTIISSKSDPILHSAPCSSAVTHWDLFVSVQRWQAELSDQEGVFQALQAQMGRAKEAGSQLSRLHPDRSPELERYQEKANQMTERWSAIKRQTETR